MGTRGLIGTKRKDGKIRYVYNHLDSYPTGLGDEIAKAIYKARSPKDWARLKKDIESGYFAGEKRILKIEEIDYLFHEWVYILDFENQTWSIYESIFDEKATNDFRAKILKKYKGDEEKARKDDAYFVNLGKLKPLKENISFTSYVSFREILNKENYIDHYEVEIHKDAVHFDKNETKVFVPA